MKRLLVLAVLLALGALSLAVGGLQQPLGAQAEMVIEVEQVRDNLYVFRGGGGNTAVLVGATGVTVVDTKLTGWGQVILDEIAALTDQPVTTIINTHTHFDHVNGNVEFPTTVEVVAQDTTARLMREMRPVFGLQEGPQPNIFDDNDGRALATRTYTNALTIGSGDDQVDLHYFGRAHTGGDTWVVFPALGVMHGGDAFLGKNLPIVDLNNGGSVVDFARTLRSAAVNIDVETIITGHSTLMTEADLREFADFNLEFLQAMAAAKASGQTVEEAAAGWTPSARFAEYGVPEDRVLSNARVAYAELP